MKKIFGTLAIALCLAAMVSCGGGDKQKKEQENTDPVKAQVEYFVNKAEKIAEDDYAAQEAWFTELGGYVEGLSEADQEKFAEYFEKMMAAESEDPEIIEEYADDVYEQAEEYAGDVYEQAERYAGDVYELAERYAGDVYEKAEQYADDMYEQAERYAEEIESNAYKNAAKMAIDAEDYAEDMYRDAERMAEDMYKDAERMAEDMYNGALDGYDW